MKDFSEAVISILLAICGIAITYWVGIEWLAALVQQAFDSIRP